MSRKVGDVVQLTWLRGGAILLVMFSHLTRIFEYEYLTGGKQSVFPILKVFDLGSFGVTVFFALSGCTLYLSNKNSGYAEFMIKRFFRIWPIFFISFVFYYVFVQFFNLFYLGNQPSWLSNQFDVYINVSDVLSYLFLINNYFGEYQIINGAYWSLPVEFQYYMCFPVVALLAEKGWKAPLFLIFLLYVVYLKEPFYANDYAFFQLAGSFIGGVFIGSRFLKNDIKTMSLISGALVCIASVILAISVRYGLLFSGYYYEIWVAISIVLVHVFLATDCSSLKNNACVKVFHDIGLSSYSAYLFHNLIFAVFYCIVARYVLFDSWFNQFVFSCVAILTTLLFSQFVYEHVEKRFIKLGRRLITTNTI